MLSAKLRVIDASYRIAVSLLATLIPGCFLYFDEPHPPADYPYEEALLYSLGPEKELVYRPLEETSADSPYGWLGFTWIGCADNGEPDGLPHGPFGSFHMVVRTARGEPIHHWYVPGPSELSPTKHEWLDWDEKEFSIERADGSLGVAMIHSWTSEDETVFVEVWESDPILGVQFNWPRGHDFLFAMGISRAVTLPSDVARTVQYEHRAAAAHVVAKLVQADPPDYPGTPYWGMRPWPPEWLDREFPEWRLQAERYSECDAAGGSSCLDGIQIPTMFIKLRTFGVGPPGTS